MNIALSHQSGTEHSMLYQHWLNNHQPVHCIAMNDYAIDEYEHILSSCSGIIFTGGADVHPSRYGSEHRISECTIEPDRDEREAILLENALKLRMPILAICRGVQFFSVMQGGNLIIDIPTDIPGAMIHGKLDGQDSQHTITIEAKSLLHKLTREDETTVNSAHHQAIKILPSEFLASSHAPDGIIESIEWADPTGKPFFMGVQWHPERMDYSSPCSSSIRQHFLMEAESYSLLMR
ncbi:MAG: gamma-glutamyl-gamma-aminobutyrate hydrolase family protein [Ignavibacteria bacterium]|jgi:putative glutamine amidotransferase